MNYSMAFYVPKIKTSSASPRPRCALAYRLWAINIGDKRSFSVTQWKKNFGKLRAEQFSFYPLLYEGKILKEFLAKRPRSFVCSPPLHIFFSRIKN